MEVLVLGFPRTGTQSIAAALNELGYRNVYHMREVGKNQHQKYWIAALEAKFEAKGNPFGRLEFDEFLHDFDAVTDFPASIFVDELIRAYPSAKIILSNRDEEAWYNSMLTTIWHAYSNPSPEPTAMRPLAEKYNKLVWGNDFPKYGLEAYRRHNELVRQVGKGKGKDFLVYNVRDGWEPLCGFLGKGVPEGKEFPRADDWLKYKLAHSKEA